MTIKLRLISGPALKIRVLPGVPGPQGEQGEQGDPGPQGDPGAGGSPGGSDTQIQYNDSGSFGGVAGSVWNGSTLTLDTPLILSGGVGAATPTPQLVFSEYVDQSGDVSISHIDLWGGIYGFGISSGQLNYICFEDATHRFYTTADLANPKLIVGEQVTIGHTIALAGPNALTPRLQTHGVSTATALAGAFEWNNGTDFPGYIFAKSRGAIGSHTVVQADDRLGGFFFCGSDGTVFRVGAEIDAFVDGTPGGSDMPTRLAFYTTADGDAGPNERIRISSSGYTNINYAGIATFAGAPVRLTVAGDANVEWSSRLATFGNNAFGPALNSSKTRHASDINSHVTVNDNDLLMEWYVYASDGAAFENCGYMAWRVDGTPASGIVPTEWIVRVQNAAGSTVDGLNIRPDRTVATFARIEEPLVTLADAANVTLNAALGNVFFLAAGGNRTIDAPTNAPAANRTQKIVIRHEGTGGARTLTLAGGAGGFRFGTDITGLTETASGTIDYIGCIWNQADGVWDVVSYSRGF